MKIGVSSRGGKSKGLMSILDDYSSAKLRSTFKDVGKRGLNKMVEATLSALVKLHPLGKWCN